MTPFMRWARSIIRSPSLPRKFPVRGYPVVDAPTLLDEERFEEFKSGDYYPVHIGDVYASKYQVVGKLGFGTTSTVWLARDLQEHQNVVLKMYVRNVADYNEYAIYKYMNEVADRQHKGYRHVRTALDMITIPRPGGDHKCLVQKPMWESIRELLYRNSTHLFSEDLLKEVLKQLFSALDYLHTECRLVHTDLSAGNILMALEDDSVIKAFTKAELEEPSARKIVDGMPVYASRQFRLPKEFGMITLGDFGSAVRGDEKRVHIAQPDFYRSPEVLLKAEWSYPVDIWNVGTMIWALFEGEDIFTGQDPDGEGYRIRAHLAEIIAILGPPPPDLVDRGGRSHLYFDKDRQWIAEIPIPERPTLEMAEGRLQGKDKEMFLEMMKGMLQWRPEDRKTAKQLLEDPWLYTNVE